jgi:hypothetical protein
VRTLVISDLHLGSRNGVDVLRRPAARDALLEALDGVDRLVLLGRSCGRSASGSGPTARQSWSPATTTPG